MFITILYGDHKTLLFNPSCLVVNLLNSIKERCGYGDTDRVLDLTDETGLVLELPSHKNECATKYLTLKGFYILVEKRTVTSHEPHDYNDMGPTQEVQYVPLLTSPCDRFKGYNTRVAEKRPTLQQSGHRSTVGKVGKRGGRMKAKKSIAESTSPV